MTLILRAGDYKGRARQWFAENPRGPLEPEPPRRMPALMHGVSGKCQPQFEFPEDTTLDEYVEWWRDCITAEARRLIAQDESARRCEEERRQRPVDLPHPSGPQPKLRQRKIWHVVAHGLGTSATVDHFWSRFGDHPARLSDRTNMVVTAIDCHDGDLRMVVVYTVAGGHPSDFRRWVGRQTVGRKLTPEELDATCVEKLDA
ncbi:hypothetical protein [Calidifontibacter terrae]